ncbi:MAG: hypothetical protein HC836_48225 [Richelia sp. RM2_1_2]|nr:hypothetical protein [Richelia sp. RM2_1_2]
MLASSIYPLAINAQNIGQTSQPLIVKKSTIWQEKNISVCWENAGNNNTERNWVRDAIARTWEKESTIRFCQIGGNCQADTKGNPDFN